MLEWLRLYLESKLEKKKQDVVRKRWQVVQLKQKLEALKRANGEL